MALTQVDQGLLGTYAQYTGFKNRIINGAMVIDQRNAGASVTPNGTYTLDRWSISNSQTGKLTVQQNAGSVTPPVGFTNYLGVTSTSAYSVLSGDYFWLGQRIEGFNTADLAWGTANAQTITLSFWVRSSLTGTFGGALRNDAGNYNYPFSYTVSSANTWEQKSITITGATSGTWLKTNGNGIELDFSLGIGSTYGSGTAGAWTTSNYYAPTGATSVVGTNGATFYITGVQLEKGSTATSFDYRPYGTELNLCQRYFYRIDGASNATIGAGHLNTSTDVRSVVRHPVTMRGNPSVTFTGTAFFYSASNSLSQLGSMTAADLTPQSVLFYSGSGTTAGTQGQGCFWVLTNTNSFISVSAEL
jgi:hypothetical protein